MSGVSTLATGTGAVSLNGATTIAADADVTRSNVGGNVVLSVYNSDSTNSASNAKVRVLSNNSGGGDAFVDYIIAGQFEWVAGIDNSDGDAFVFSRSDTLGSLNVVKMTAADSVVVGRAVLATTATDGFFVYSHLCRYSCWNADYAHGVRSARYRHNEQ